MDDSVLRIVKKAKTMTMSSPMKATPRKEAKKCMTETPTKKNEINHDGDANEVDHDGDADKTEETDGDADKRDEINHGEDAKNNDAKLIVNSVANDERRLPASPASSCIS